MSLFRLSVLGLCLGFALHAPTAMADAADWDSGSGGPGDDGDDEGDESGDDGGDESGDDGGDESGDDDGDESGDDDGDDGGEEASDDDEGDDEGGCATAAINPTTLLSVGLGVGLLFGLRRRTD